MKKMIFFCAFALFYLACKKEPVPIIKTYPPKIDTIPVVLKSIIKTDSIFMARTFGSVAIDLDGDKVNDVKVSSYWYSSGMCFNATRSMDSVWTLNSNVKVFSQTKTFVYTRDTSKLDTTYHVTGGINNGGKNVEWTRKKDVVLKMDSLQLYQTLPEGKFSDGGFVIKSSVNERTNCPPYSYMNGRFFYIYTDETYSNGNGKWVIFEKNSHFYAIKIEDKIPYMVIKSGFKIK